jgi:tetratricopeptide (TPR) repeat protein
MLAAAAMAELDRVDEALALSGRAAEAFPTASQPAAFAATLLASRGRWQESLAFAKVWRERAVTDKREADLAVAQAELRLLKTDETMRRLKPYLDASATQDVHRVEPAVVIYAAAQSAAGQVDAAANLLQPYLKSDQQWRSVWLSFISENLEPEPVRQWLERLQPLIPEASINERTLLAQAWNRLGQRTGDKEYAQQGEKMLGQLMERKDLTDYTAVSMAMILEVKGDTAGAEIHYRKALALNPRSILAQNNLAMLLARDTEHPEKLAEALQLASLAAQTESQAATLDTLAFVQSKIHKNDDAIINMRKAVELAGGNVKYRVTLLQLLADAKRIDEANAVLRDVDGLRRPGSLDAETALRLEVLRARLARQ